MNNQTIQIKLINHSDHPDPEYATLGSSGVDLKAFIPNPVTLAPLQRAAIPTGIHVELPPSFELQIRPRSGMAINHGITCLNTPGTIDSDYRGEIKVILINLGDKEYTITNGDRIAQMVLASVEKISWLNATQIEKSERGAGGFGHTGK